MSEWILDLNDCKELPEYLKGFTEIPCMTGVNELDFDVILSETPRDVVSVASGFANNKGKPLPSNDIPFGFNLEAIPKGAKLVKMV